MSKNLAFILYSHSSLEWILPAFKGLQKEYFPIDCPKYVFCDKEVNLEEYKCFTYSNEDKYSKRLAECLSKVEEEFVIIHHEDMLFFDDVDMDYFNYYLEVMKTSDASYIKMLRGGLSQQSPERYMNGIYKVPIDEPYKFVIQPAIWRKEHLLRILTHYGNCSIYELEEGGVVHFIVENNFQCLFAYNEGDRKRGMYHWDNSKYPFIATALNKGEWNLVEYDIEIENIRSEYALP